MIHHLPPIKVPVAIATVSVVNFVAAAAEHVNWASLGSALAIAFIAFMQVVQQYQSRLRTEQLTRQAELAKVQSAKLQEVHQLVNSGMGEQLFIGMIAAESLLVAAPTKTNEVLAQKARAKYEEHQRRQAGIDQGKIGL